MIIEWSVATTGTELLSVTVQGQDCALQGYLAVPGDAFGCHDLGRWLCCFRHLGTLEHTTHVPFDKVHCLIKKVSSVNVEKLN